MNHLMQWCSQHTLLLFAIAIIVCNFVWLSLCRKILAMNMRTALLIAVLHDIVGFLAMRVMAVIEVGCDFSKAAYIRLFGATFFLPLFYYGWAKKTHRNMALVMDIAAICTIIGLIFGRLDCLVGGCCRGMLLPGSTSLHWPLREMELIYYAVFMAVYCRKILQGKTYGEVYPVYMISYGAIRFILEWFRVEFTTRVGIFHLAHLWALLSLGIGISIYGELQKKEKKTGGRRNG